MLLLVDLPPSTTGQGGPQPWTLDTRRVVDLCRLLLQSPVWEIKTLSESPELDSRTSRVSQLPQFGYRRQSVRNQAVLKTSSSSSSSILELCSEAQHALATWDPGPSTHSNKDAESKAPLGGGTASLLQRAARHAKESKVLAWRLSSCSRASTGANVSMSI